MERIRKLIGFKSQHEINGSILGRTPDILGENFNLSNVPGT
jgi:hypothetical protein